VGQSYQQATSSSARPEWEHVFERAVVEIFKTWTVIRLAIDQDWSNGGRTREKVNEVVQELFTICLNRKRKPLSPSNPADILTIAEFLAVKLYEKIEAELEDDSDREVSMIILRLLEECRLNNFNLAKQIIERAESLNNVAQCKFEDQTQLATEDDVLLDSLEGGMSSMQIDTVMEEPENEVDNAPDNAAVLNNPANNTAQQGPTMDDDGFQTVTNRKRK
jgi:hypothetical protein